MVTKWLQTLVMLCIVFLGSFTCAHANLTKNAAPGGKKKKYDLSVCAIFRDEARFLKEWIEFHRMLGVDHFYLCNHLSQDNYIDVLKPYVKQKIVEIIEWNKPFTQLSEWGVIQTTAYQRVIDKARKETEWLAILDTDEFLFPTHGDDLNKVLKKYDLFGAVCVNWQMFGTSGVPKVRSDQLLIEMLTQKAPEQYGENRHVKSIVKPSRVKACNSPHFCHFHPPFYQVDENREHVSGPWTTKVSVNILRINHYWSRDEEFFTQVKIKRRAQWSEGSDGCWRRNKNLNQERDQTILRFVKRLKQRV